MDINKIPAGKDVPHSINVIIEIPLGGDPIKYELDKDSGALFVDRFLNTSMVYPANYGFMPHTLSQDGDPVDCLVMSRVPVFPGVVIPSRPIGVLKMEDESGPDEKILCVPLDKTKPFYSEVSCISDLPEIRVKQVEHFFAHYKALDPGKWVKIEGWGDVEESKKLILEGLERAK